MTAGRQMTSLYCLTVRFMRVRMMFRCGAVIYGEFQDYEKGDNMKTLILSRSEVQKCITAKDVLEKVEYVFREWGEGNIVQPAKINLDMSRSGYSSWCNAMPAYLVSSNAAGIKWIGGFGENVKTGGAYIQGAIILTDTKTGQTLAVMDGSLITNLRTGASAAVASKYMARKDLRKITIIGAGEQGRNCLRCFDLVYKNLTAFVVDISEEHRKTFIDEMSKEVSAVLVDSPKAENAVRESDVIVLVTTAKKPFVKEDWISPGALVLAMGSFQQVEDNFALSADKIIVDSWAQASHRGELKQLVEDSKISESDISTELGNVVAGNKEGRKSDTERILTVLVGLGAHDICIGHHIYRKAKEMNLGCYAAL